MRVLLLAVMAVVLTALPASAAPAEGTFMSRQLRPGPTPGTLMVASYLDRSASATYDAALAALWLMAAGRRDEAGRVLAGLAALQRPDGALPFSYSLSEPGEGPAYVRSGAVGWAGYAAARYLNDAPDGPHREAIAIMAHHLAGYLLAHRVTTPGDPREGLILGGSGRYAYDVADDGLHESFVPGEIEWASTEHNIDAYFFLRALGRATGRADYTRAAGELGRIVVERLWSDDAGQFNQGMGAAPDRTLALDCASWGALFLQARGDTPRARRAYEAAEKLYAATDPDTGVSGHRPYARRAVIENRALAAYFHDRVSASSWEALPAVWPEGSAGVALAAWRLGKKERAQAILAQLDRLRSPSGGLPCLTREIPLEFETAPALAGTAWVALVRHEMASERTSGLVWGP